MSLKESREIANCSTGSHNVMMSIAKKRATIPEEIKQASNKIISNRIEDLNEDLEVKLTNFLNEKKNQGTILRKCVVINIFLFIYILYINVFFMHGLY